MIWAINAKATNRKPSDGTTAVPVQETEIIINVYDLLPVSLITVWLDLDQPFPPVATEEKKDLG